MRSKPLSIAASVALLAGTALAYGTAEPATDRDLDVEVALVANSGGPAVGGTYVNGLYPGAKRGMTLTVKNPYRYAISLRKVTGKVVSTNRKSCSASSANLIVGRYTGKPALPVRIAGGKRVQIGILPLEMPRTVADACQNVTFTLRLSATARKATK